MVKPCFKVTHIQSSWLQNILNIVRNTCQTIKVAKANLGCSQWSTKSRSMDFEASFCMTYTSSVVELPTGLIRMRVSKREQESHNDGIIATVMDISSAWPNRLTFRGTRGRVVFFLHVFMWLLISLTLDRRIRVEDLYTENWQTSRGSFSAVSNPSSAEHYSVSACSIVEI